MIIGKANRFIATYRSVLAVAAANDPAIDSFVDDLSAVDLREAVDRSAEGTKTHPALQHLEQAMAALRGDASYVSTVREIIPHIAWGGSYQGSGPGAAVAPRMIWGEIVGPNGIVTSDSIKLGFFLLSPGTFYPLHGHHALEIYSVVSGAMTVTLGLDNPTKRLVAAPGHSVTPEAEAHALQVGAEPVLIIYCWTGDLFAPVWWWERNEGGRWSKVFPTMVTAADNTS